MADIDQMKSDLAATKANLAEIQGDMDEVQALNGKQLEKITELEDAIVGLKKQLGDMAELDALAAGLGELKELSRQVADKQPEPTPET